MNPRPYQQECILKVLEGFKRFKRQLAVCPTGAGKTVIFSLLAQKYLPRKTLILAHREELIDQAIAKLHAATGIFAQKEKAEHRASLQAEVVVASVQSIINRLHRWPSNHFGLIVADEAHHAISSSWQSVLRHFDGHTLGVTATPDRGDQRNLGSYFENIAFEISLFDLIHQGYLSKISVQSVPLRIDMRRVKQSAGDYDAAQVGSALEPYLDEIAAAIYEHAYFRKTLAFLPLIATSKKFVDACKNAGLSAMHVDGNSEDRKEIAKQFEGDDFQVVSNAMLWTEGYDNPSVDCICNLRPTRSRSLYSQIVGRGTRIYPGKENLLLLDFLWQHEKHNLIRPAHLVAGSDDEAEEITEASKEHQYGEEQIDLEQLCSETQAQREKKLRDELRKSAKRQAKIIDAMEICLDMGGEIQASLDWENEGATLGQSAVLAKYEIDPNAMRNVQQADKIINLIVQRERAGLASPKQLKRLIEMGHPDAHKLTKGQAGAYLGNAYADFRNR